MTLEEYNKLKEEVLKEERAHWEHNIKLFEQGVSSTLEYYMEYMESKEITLTYSLENINIYELREEIDSVIEKIEEEGAQNKPGFRTELLVSANADYNDCDTEYVYIEQTYYEPVDKDRFKEISLRIFKQEIEKLLNPGNADWRRTISCNVLQMFEEGNIDWKTMHKLTYSDCSI
jgi:hypothetical protein